MKISGKFDVLVVGELNVDLILNQIDKFPEVGKEVLAQAMTLALGSSSAIFASNLATLGSAVGFAGKLGQDSFGDFVVSRLAAKGVNVENIILSPRHQTGATVVLNFGEDRAMVTHPGAMAHFTVADISEAALKQARHLHVSSIFLQPGLFDDLPELFRKAKAFGLTVSLDPQWDPHEKWDIDLKNLLSAVDIFLPNAAELKALTQTSDLDEALEVAKSFDATTVVKDGRNGACMWDGAELVRQPAMVNNQVVDSIGAGDSFNAGFIHAFLQRKSGKECLKFGTLTGAINTTRAGGTGAFENLDMVRSIALSNFNCKI